jgi:hypothetical protein
MVDWVSGALKSVSITLVVLLAAAFANAFLKDKRLLAQIVWRDVLVRLLVRLDCFRWARWISLLLVQSPFAFGTILWLTVSFALGVIPFFIWDPQSFLVAETIFVTVNFTLFVPMLFGAYMYLAVAATEVLSPATMMALGIAKSEDRAEALARNIVAPWSGRLIQWLIIFASLAIQVAAVRNDVIIKGGGHHGAFDNVDGATVLSNVGVVYYSLLGIDAYLALNLFVLAAMLMKAVHADLSAPEAESHFLTDDFRPAREICRFCTASLLCLVLATLICGVHGVVILTDALGAGKPEVIFTSTWGLFFLMTLAGILIVAACIYRFYEALEKEKARILRALITESEQRHKAGSELGIDELSMIMDFSKRVRTVPLGGIGKASVVVLVFSQSLNVATAIVGLVGLLVSRG